MSDTLAPKTLSTKPGKTTCASFSVPESVKPALLCVTRGQFAHDTYEVRIADVRVVQGIDDATTNGITGQHNGQAIHLKCDPVLSGPTTPTDAQMAQLRAAQPKASRKQLETTFLAMNRIETGRRCVVRSDKSELYAVDVLFD